MHSDRFTSNAYRQLSLSLRSIIVGVAVVRKALSERLLLNTWLPPKTKQPKGFQPDPEISDPSAAMQAKQNIAALISRQFMLLVRLKNVGFELCHVSRGCKRTFQHERAGDLNACPCFTFCLAVSASLALCISGTCSHLFTLSFHSLFTLSTLEGEKNTSCFSSWQAHFNTYARLTSRAKTNSETTPQSLACHSVFILKHTMKSRSSTGELLIGAVLGLTGYPEVEAVDRLPDGCQFGFMFGRKIIRGGW